MNSDTCTRCRQGLYLLSGRCHHVCPEDYEPSDKLMECTLQGQSEQKVIQKPQKSRMTDAIKFFFFVVALNLVHCEVGEWGEWSPCSRSGRTCGFKRGQETRTRQVLRYPSPFGNPCPDISEIKECLVKRRKCPGKEDVSPGNKNLVLGHCLQ